MSLPRYPAYKASGVAWLGEVPKHWEIRPLKSTATGKGSLFMDGDWIESRNIADGGIRYITTGNVGPGFYKEQGSGFISEETFELLNCTDVFAGDVLISRLNAPIGRACIVPDLAARVVTSVDNVVVRPSPAFDRRFLVFRLTSVDYFHEAGNLASGATMQRISRSELGNIRIAFPPFGEQVKIASFLERETGKIDALIAEQEKLIALLAEKRQATISHAVTRGLNPDAPMKDSGVAWLGEVPAHWAIKRVKHIKAPIPNAFVDGPFGSNLKSEHFIDDGDVYVIESNFATQNKIDEVGLKTISLAHFETIARSEVSAGDIVIAKIGAQFGKASILPTLSKRSVVSGNSLKLTVNGAICTVDWIHLQFINLKASGEIDLLANGSAQPALSLGAMNNLPILLPPLAEQVQVTRFVATETTKLDTLKSEAERAITLLKERRSALIAAAVTGQIDVR